MRRIITFFAGLVLLALTVAMLVLTSAIYDTSSQESIITYFFQRNDWSMLRPGTPVRASDISETTMREMLIKKYVTEYFYAVPDYDDITRRMNGSTVLARMSSSEVFDEWKRGEAVGIRSMAQNNMMRTVEIAGEIFKPSDSDYWVVPYVLRTWSKPNDMSLAPQITRGTLLLNIRFKNEIREYDNSGRPFDIGQYLKLGYNRFEFGYDPAAIFRFQVIELKRGAND